MLQWQTDDVSAGEISQTASARRKKRWQDWLLSGLVAKS
jgi:hypothetical protein